MRLISLSAQKTSWFRVLAIWLAAGRLFPDGKLSGPALYIWEGRGNKLGIKKGAKLVCSIEELGTDVTTSEDAASALCASFLLGGGEGMGAFLCIDRSVRMPFCAQERRPCYRPKLLRTSSDIGKD